MKTEIQKSIKHTVFLILAVLMSAAFIITPPLTAESFGKTKLPGEGEIILFGKYEQDGDDSNGAEDIEWLVLKTEPDQNRILVISRYSLDVQPYNREFASVTWENCSLRKWLNRDFFNTAFSAKEQRQIPTVTVENKDNPKWGTPGGKDTNDKVFCLSIEEMETYFGDYQFYSADLGWGYNRNLICTPTQYALDRSAFHYTISKEDYYDKTWYNPQTLQKDLKLSDIYPNNVIGLTGCKWWLRSPGGVGFCVSNVYDFGESGVSYNSYVNAQGRTVRPALYIEIR